MVHTGSFSMSATGQAFGARSARMTGSRETSDPAPLHAVRFSGSDANASLPVGIVASLGPASASAEVMARMMKAGVSTFRIDFARGTHAAHAETIARLRSVSEKLVGNGEIAQPAKLMADLQGPRIAVGNLAAPLQLKAGYAVRLSPQESADQPDVIPTTYPELVSALVPGNRIIINDGKAVLEVVQAASAATDGMAVCRVVKPGTVSSNLGINAPDAPLKTPALMEKDLADLQFALEQGMEVITQSYPASAADVEETRARIQAYHEEHGSSAKDTTLIAKIERPQSVAPAMLDAIAKAADGIMVARGDLATETGLENLPDLQHQIIQAARRNGKTVIVANKLLGSMINSDQPSRSDVFDVVQAVQDGAHMLMLTGETSAGQFPVESAEMAARLIRKYAPEASQSTERKSHAQSGQSDSLLSGLRELGHQCVDWLVDWVRQTLLEIQGELQRLLKNASRTGKTPPSDEGRRNI